MNDGTIKTNSTNLLIGIEYRFGTRKNDGYNQNKVPADSCPVPVWNQYENGSGTGLAVTLQAFFIPLKLGIRL